MSKNISMTLPDVVVAALNAKGKPLEMTGSEYLKQYVIAAGLGEVGALKLCDKVSELVAEQAAVEKAASDLQAALVAQTMGEEPERELFGAVDTVVLSLPGAGAASKDKGNGKETGAAAA